MLSVKHATNKGNKPVEKTKSNFACQFPSDVIISRLQGLLDEKLKIERVESWRKEDLVQLKSLFDINCNFYKYITGKVYPQNW